MAPQVPVEAVTFDAGQTLVELDTAMLAARLGERGAPVDAAALEAAAPLAWQRFDARAALAAQERDEARRSSGGSGNAVAGGHAGGGWHGLIRDLLAGAGAPGDHAALVDWLWSEQPRRNLWRRPIAGMRELVDDLRRAGVAVGVVSNSEGRIAELFAEIGWGDRFACVADSGRLGIEKPDPLIFTWALERLGAPPARAVHVGDSWAADIAGARAAGMRAIWFGPRARPVDEDQDVAACADAGAVRAALAAWGCRVG
jgi:HAD superfamily hydrolase (TIGR01509 family)